MVGLVVWNTVALDNRVSHAERRAHGMTDALTVLSDPRAQAADLVSDTRPLTRLIAAYVPGRQEMSIIGRGIPAPAGGHVDGVWLVSPGGGTTYVGSFLPDAGTVALSFYVDLRAFNALIVTDEEGGPGARPGKIRWATEL